MSFAFIAIPFVALIASAFIVTSQTRTSRCRSTIPPRRPGIGRARALLGWEPETALRKGLRHRISWFEADLRNASGETAPA